VFFVALFSQYALSVGSPTSSSSSSGVIKFKIVVNFKPISFLILIAESWIAIIGMLPLNSEMTLKNLFVISSAMITAIYL